MESQLALNNEAELHAAWRAGDSRAGGELIVRYLPRLRRFGVRLGLGAGELEDLAHEVLLEAPRSSYEARRGATYWDWLAVIARRKAARMSRRECEVFPIRRCSTPWGGACRQQLLEALDQMPTHLRDVFVWLVVGYDSAEIGRELGLEPTAVRMRIHRGRKWLRAHGY